MKKNISLKIGLATFLSAALVASAAFEAGAQPVTGTLRAGADVRPVCTLSGVPLAGYGGTPRRKIMPAFEGYTFMFNPDQGVHDNTRVKTLVLEVQSNPPVLFAFISIDAIGFSANIAPAVENAIQGTGLDRYNIMFMGTHTHSGAGGASDKAFWEVAAADLFNQDLFDHLVGNIVDSISAALSNMQPARLGISVGYENTITENRVIPLGPVDARVGVIKVESDLGAPLAVLFNFAAHQTCLGGSNMEVTADNAGYAERYLETQIPGVVPVYTNAAEGDVKPNQGGWTGAQVVGETLGAKVKDLWDNTLTDPEVTFELQTSVVQLPTLVVNLAACDPILEALLATFPLPHQLAESEELFMAVRLNTDAFVSVPGEAVTEIGLQIQSDLLNEGWDHVFIMGLANGYMGYIVTPQMYDGGAYEACGTLHGRDTGVFIRNTVVSVGQLLTPPSTAQPDGGVPDGGGGGDGSLDDSAVAADASGDSQDASGVGPAPDKGCGCRTASSWDASRSALPALMPPLALMGLMRFRLRRKTRATKE